jgi:hypothetical protein
VRYIFGQLVLLIFISSFLVGCEVALPTAQGTQPDDLNLPASQPGDISQPTPQDETPTSTPTIVWFPPTSTPTPFPTQELVPTPEMRPGVGAVILTDDFSTANSWSLGTSGEGRAALSKNELTLAIGPTAAKDYILSLRQEPQLSDFYAEITASPSLCRGGDEYGLLVRAASTQDYYRFALTCNGQARVDRIIQNNTTSPQPWVDGAVPPGAPSTSRIAVWAVGREMRFFVNDEYVFTINDPLLPQGSLGVFARSVNDNAVTINFSNLIIREVTP